MPQADVGHEFVAAFNRRDLPALLLLVNDDIEIVPIRAAVEDVVYRGKDGLAQWLRDIDDSWSELRIELDHVEELAAGRQVVHGRVVGRGSESAAPVEMTVRWLGQLRDGRFTRIETVFDR